MNELKMELLQLNEAIDTITTTLDAFGHDPELVEQLRKLLKEREQLIERMNSIH